MDRTAAMTAFVAVAELAGFTPAARKLRISPSAVTRLVAALEDHLELRLLHRTTRSVSLTDAGARYLDRARHVLAALAEAEAVARSERIVPTGRFVVAAPNVFGRREIAPLLAELLATYPAITGELVLSDRNSNLVDDGIDVAVRIGVLADSSLHARTVGRTRRVLVASPAYLAAHKRPREPADLARHRLLQFTGIGDAWRFLRDDREHAVAIAPAFSSNSADAVIEHAKRDGGIAMVLSYQVADAIRAGELDIVMSRYEPPPIPIQLVYPSARLLSATVRVFIELASTRSWNFV
ncbi:MAG: LysR family transcriptional regulator [Deltaproteobacteria bacterium]|nr:LysR family transcriptional regulator [Deltaproteobacteria bacterium]